MLSQREVIQVEESVNPLLLYPNPGEPYRQRLAQYLQCLYPSTRNINSSAHCMGAWCFLSGLDAMARAAVATGNRQWSPQLIAKNLQVVHKTFIHRALTSLTTAHFFK